MRRDSIVRSRSLAKRLSVDTLSFAPSSCRIRRVTPRHPAGIRKSVRREQRWREAGESDRPVRRSGGRPRRSRGRRSTRSPTAVRWTDAIVCGMATGSRSELAFAQPQVPHGPNRFISSAALTHVLVPDLAEVLARAVPMTDFAGQRLSGSVVEEGTRTRDSGPALPDVTPATPQFECPEPPSRSPGAARG